MGFVLIGSALLWLGAGWQMLTDVKYVSALYLADNRIRKSGRSWWGRIFLVARSNERLAREYKSIDGLPGQERILEYDRRASGWLLVFLGAFFTFIGTFIGQYQSSSAVLFLTVFVTAVVVFFIFFFRFNRKEQFLAKEYEGYIRAAKRKVRRREIRRVIRQRAKSQES